MSSIHITSIHPSVRPSVHCQSHQTIYISSPLLSSPLSYYSSPPPSLSLNPCLNPFQTLTDFTSSFSLFFFSSSSLISSSLFHSLGFDFDFSLHNLQTFIIHLYTNFIFHLMFTSLFSPTVAPVLLSKCSPDHSAYIFSAFHSKSFPFTIY